MKGQFSGIGVGLSGGAVPFSPDVYAVGDEVLLRFVTDSATIETGWELNYTCIPGTYDIDDNDDNM